MIGRGIERGIDEIEGQLLVVGAHSTYIGHGVEVRPSHLFGRGDNILNLNFAII